MESFNETYSVHWLACQAWESYIVLLARPHLLILCKSFGFFARMIQQKPAYFLWAYISWFIIDFMCEMYWAGQLRFIDEKTKLSLSFSLCLFFTTICFWKLSVLLTPWFHIYWSLTQKGKEGIEKNRITQWKVRWWQITFVSEADSKEKIFPWGFLK